MINYTDILLEAYEDNHIYFLDYFQSKEKLSIRKDRIEIMYIQWFLSKAQIIERDFFLDSDTFIPKCLYQCTLMMEVFKGDESKKIELLEFGFMLLALDKMYKVMNETELFKNFTDYLSCDNKNVMIEKIRTLLEDAGGARVANLLKVLHEMDIANYSLETKADDNAKKKIYQSIRVEFNLTFSDESANKQFRLFEEYRQKTDRKILLIESDKKLIRETLEG